MINLENIIYSENPIFNKINTTIEDGSVVILEKHEKHLAETLLNIIGLIEKPISGKVYINNIDTFLLNEKELGNIRVNYLGFLFEEPLLIDYFTVSQNLEIIFEYAKMKKHEKHEKVFSVTKYLNIDNFLKKYPTDLSNFEKQLVYLAKAIILNPIAILIYDISSCMNEEEAELFFNLLSKVNKDKKITLISLKNNNFINVVLL
jgi:ABC-type lipoprotein export system ATPase subunit